MRCCVSGVTERAGTVPTRQYGLFSSHLFSNPRILGKSRGTSEKSSCRTRHRALTAQPDTHTQAGRHDDITPATHLRDGQEAEVARVAEEGRVQVRALEELLHEESASHVKYLADHPHGLHHVSLAPERQSAPATPRRDGRETHRQMDLLVMP
jgi:hypothetical protein